MTNKYLAILLLLALSESAFAGPYSYECEVLEELWLEDDGSIKPLHKIYHNGKFHVDRRTGAVLGILNNSSYETRQIIDPGGEEQVRRNSVRRDSRDTDEDHREHRAGQEWLEHEPYRTENGLLVDGEKVSPHEQPNEVSVLPQAKQIHIEPRSVGRDECNGSIAAHGPEV